MCAVVSCSRPFDTLINSSSTHDALLFYLIHPKVFCHPHFEARCLDEENQPCSPEEGEQGGMSTKVKSTSEGL